MTVDTGSDTSERAIVCDSRKVQINIETNFNLAISQSTRINSFELNFIHLSTSC